MLTNFMYLLFTHYVFDFSLQSEFMSNYKYKVPFVMFVHVFIWVFGLYAMSDLLSMNVPTFLWPIMFAMHYYSDWKKCDLIEKKYKDAIDLTPVKNLFHIDQAVHIAQVLLISVF